MRYGVVETRSSIRRADGETRSTGIHGQCSLSVLRCFLVMLHSRGEYRISSRCDCLLACPMFYRVWARGLDSNQSFIEPNLDYVIYGMPVLGPGLIPRPDLFPVLIVFCRLLRVSLAVTVSARTKPRPLGLC